MEVDCGIDCFSLKYTWRLGVNYHRSYFLVDGLNHAFGNSGPIGSVGRAWFVCCNVRGEHQAEGLVVVFSVAIVAPKSFYFVSHGVNSGLG